MLFGTHGSRTPPHRDCNAHRGARRGQGRRRRRVGSHARSVCWCLTRRVAGCVVTRRHAVEAAPTGSTGRSPLARHRRRIAHLYVFFIRVVPALFGGGLRASRHDRVMTRMRPCARSSAQVRGARPRRPRRLPAIIVMGRPILPGKERQEKGRRVLPSRILCRAGGRGGLEPAGHSAHFPNNVASRWVLQPPWKHGRIAQRLGGAGSPRSLRLRHDVLVREIDARTADLGSVSFDGQKAGCCPENNLTT